MRKYTIACCLLILTACKKEAPPPAEAPPPPPANWAGNWNVQGFNAAGDSLVRYTITATSSDSGWTINFPNRPPVPVHVVAKGGDSVVTMAGPYESVLRRGVQVSTEATFHMMGDSIHGNTMAHYSRGPDTLLAITARGVRMP